MQANTTPVTDEMVEKKAKDLCFAICSNGGFLDYENGCCRTCSAVEACQGWRALTYNARLALESAPSPTPPRE